jgi:hypothetical protein
MASESSALQAFSGSCESFAILDLFGDSVAISGEMVVVGAALETLAKPCLYFLHISSAANLRLAGKCESEC